MNAYQHLESLEPNTELIKTLDIFQCPMDAALYPAAHVWLEAIVELTRESPEATGKDILGNVSADMTAEICGDEPWAAWLHEQNSEQVSHWSILTGGMPGQWTCRIGITDRDIAMRFKLTFC